MKYLSLLTMVTQFGISIIVPPFVFLYLGNWLQNKYQMGPWITILLGILGFLIAFSSARSGIRYMLKEIGVSRDKVNKNKKEDSHGISFNNHD